ncbi:uncharacterized protein [Diadema setosum]|uniref:uncharacterized protein n=1 Tax=Diadema setosum TaxID=31175 RepID=UPI003B3A5DD2
MAEKQSCDVDSVLKAIARDIPDDEAIEDLGKELGFAVGDIKNFIRTNSRYDEITSYGTERMLWKWSHRVSPSSLRSDLREALMRAKLVRIAETHLPSASSKPLLEEKHVQQNKEELKKYYRESWLTMDQLTSSNLPSLEEKQVQQCKEELKKYYRESRRTLILDPLNFMERVNFDEIFTNLSLTDRSSSRRTPITYEDILANDESGNLTNRLLIQGEGGVGKTTLSSKIAWDWCQGRILHDLDWVIVIPLRDVTADKSIGAIVRSYLSDCNAATPDQIDGYISEHQSRILLVLDGFDEFSEDLDDRSNSEVARILAMEQYKSCTVIVTTRPWRSHAFKITKKLAETYTFINVEGFTEENLTNYIRRYFKSTQKNALAESLISFMEENDIIRSNMAPFPIYCAMLCLMWNDFSEDKRKKMSKLQTFSQIFGEIISFLIEHYASKECEHLHDQEIDDHLTKAERAIRDISEIALNGLLDKSFTFPEEQFKDCNDAMETCCKVGVLTIDKGANREGRQHGGDRLILPQHAYPQRDSTRSVVKSEVSFPHKLFQEYLGGVYVANVYVSDRAKYEQLKKRLIHQREELRYLLYFASALGKELGLDIIKDLLKCANKDFCIDVAFECHTEEAAQTVGEGWKEYKLSINMPQHTQSGVAFMVSFDQARSLFIDKVICGRTMSRDLAEGMCSSCVLRKVTIEYSKFHADFYKASNCQLQDVNITIGSWNDGSRHHSSMGGNLAKWAVTMSSLSSFSLNCSYLDGDFLSTAIASASSCQIQDMNFSLKRWYDGSEQPPSRGGDFAQWVFTLPSLLRFSLTCPYLDGDFLSTAISSASSCQIQDLMVSLEDWDDGSEHESSVGGDLAQLVTSLPSLSSFSLGCNYLDGDFLSAAIALASSCQIRDLTVTLEDYDDTSEHESSVGGDLAQLVTSLPSLSSFSLNRYYLDGDFLSAAITLASSCQIRDLKVWFKDWDDGSEHESSVGGDLAQLVTSLPSLSSFSLDCNYLDGDFLSAAIALASSCQLRHLDLISDDWGSDDSHASSLRKDLAQVICTLPHLSTFSVICNLLSQDDFFSTAATLAQSCQIRKLSMKFETYYRQSSRSPSAATHLAKFLCHMPHLKRADINCTDLPETFFTGMASQPANCKLEDITINDKPLNQWLDDK